MTVHHGTTVTLTARQAAMLVTLGDLSRLRQRNQHRTDPELADLLSSLASAANVHMSSCAAATGKSEKPRAVASSRSMNVSEAAARLGTTEQAVRRALSEKRLKGEKVDGRWKITTTALDDFDSRLHPHAGIADMTVRLMLHARAQAVGLDELLVEMRDAGLRFAIADEERGQTESISEVGMILVHADGTHVDYIPDIPGGATAALPAHGSEHGE